MNNKSEDRNGRLVGWAQIGLLALVFVAGVYFARAPTVPGVDQEVIRNTRPPAVRVIEPTAGSHALTLTLSGEIGAKAPVALRPLVSGRIVEVSPSLRPGGTFNAGEVLLAVDPADAELQLRVATGLHTSELARARRHREQGALDAQEWRRENPGLTVPDIVARLPQIERFEARAQAAEAEVRRAEQRLAETRLSLPFAGTVVAATATVGQFVAGGGMASVGSVFETGELQAVASIAVGDLAYLGDPRGLAASISVGNRNFDAMVSSVAPVLESQTRLATLMFDFVDVGDDVELPMPGTFARISLNGPPFDDAFLLPDAAHQGDDSVWVVDDGRLRQAVPRTLARTDAGWIVAAFDAGDGVVLGAVPGERPGLAVTALDAGQ